MEKTIRNDKCRETTTNKSASENKKRNNSKTGEKVKVFEEKARRWLEQ